MSEKQSIEGNRIYSHLTRSRFLHIEDALAIGKLRLFVGEGAIKPKGKPDAAVSVPLPAWETRKLAFAVLACPEPRSELAEGREPEVRSRRMANDVTTSREVEHTPTGFWSLFNLEGRAAGVEYPLAQKIANEAGEDWHKAILELCAAIDDASAETLD